MKLLLTDKKQKDLFVSLFGILKNCSSLINATFESDGVHIQGMDRAHVCLFDVKLLNSWFAEYSVNQSVNISFDSTTFHSIISTKSEGQILSIEHDLTNSMLRINFISETQSASEKKQTKNKKTKTQKTNEIPKTNETPKTTEKKDNSLSDFKKFFTMPLAEYDYEEMSIPEVDYDAEFSISAKIITDILSQLENFGEDLKVICTENDVDLMASGISGEMRVNIPSDDLTSYSIIEGETLELSYSLTYVNKLCITNKLSQETAFCISSERPMKIAYDLGGDSTLVFYIAPKIVD